jgi:hypothetical protein
VSSRDFVLYGDALNHLGGLPLEAGLAMNSIKLLFDPGNHRHRYVWIDPPWVLERGSAVVASGGDYPDPTEPAYQLKHQTWCAWVKALLDGTVLQSAVSLPDGTGCIRFSRGLNLLLLGSGGSDPERWYDDWYVKLDDA